MLNIDQIRDKLQDRRLARVAEVTGLHYNTILGVREGKTDPAYSVVKALSDYLSTSAA